MPVVPWHWNAVISLYDICIAGTFGRSRVPMKFVVYTTKNIKLMNSYDARTDFHEEELLKKKTCSPSRVWCSDYSSVPASD